MANLGTVVVVGGSLAGLMHGIVLKKMGYQVNVLERSATEALESEAAGIRAGPEVYDFIREHVRNAPEYFITAQMVEIMDGEGNVVQKLPPQHPLRLTTWKVVYDLLKDTLIGTINGEQAATYKTRHVVRDVEEAGERVKVTVSDLTASTTTSIECDLVIAADGANSAVRRKFCPEVMPQYAGYVTWRGRVPEEAVSSKTREVLQDRCAILRVEGGYQISYYVPRDGNPNSTQRDFVWIWYDNISKVSQQLVETLTDVNGESHQTTVPRGKMDPKVWQRVLDRRNSVVNPYFVDLMGAIQEPFVSAINDFQGQKAVFWNGKVLMVGDAFTLCRPHGGGSTSQAALQAQTLCKALQGEMTLEQWEESCLASAEKAARFSLAMADFFWNGKVSKSPSDATKIKPSSAGETS